jgi:hypothetical protein
MVYCYGKMVYRRWSDGADFCSNEAVKSWDRDSRTGLSSSNLDRKRTPLNLDRKRTLLLKKWFEKSPKN